MNIRQIKKLLEVRGYIIRIVSPNNPDNPIQWYTSTVKNYNKNKWRIDAIKKSIKLTVFPDETCNISYHINLSKIAEKYGIELCDEYSIGIDFWGHNENVALFPISKFR